MSKAIIYQHEWTVEQPKASLVIIHGLGEHIERYEEVAQFFNAHDIAVYGFDHMGHGQSAGKRGHIKDYESVYGYIVGQLERIPKDVPVFLYGHSMGGNMMLNYMIQRRPSIKGAISTGAFITPGTPISPMLVFLGRIMSWIYPSLLLDNGLDLTSLSTSEAVVDAYKKDALVHPKISAGLAAAMLDNAKKLRDYHGSLESPLLIMHGEKDKITGADGSQLFYDQIQSPKEIKIWKDDLHEIHNGVNKAAVWKFMLDWIMKNLS